MRGRCRGITKSVGLAMKTGLLDQKQTYLSNTQTCDVSVPNEAEIRKGVAAVIEGLRACGRGRRSRS
jgi:hypothetical protein